LTNDFFQDIFFAVFTAVPIPTTMDSEAFRECGRTVVDYLAGYIDNIRDR